MPLRLVRCNSAISPKNVPSESRTRWLGRSISTSPAVMKYIEEAAIAAPHQHFARFDGLRAQQPHDVGDFGGAQMREQRHPAPACPR